MQSTTPPPPPPPSPSPVALWTPPHHLRITVTIPHSYTRTHMLSKRHDFFKLLTIFHSHLYSFTNAPFVAIHLPHNHAVHLWSNCSSSHRARRHRLYCFHLYHRRLPIRSRIKETNTLTQIPLLVFIVSRQLFQLFAKAT